MLDAIDHHTGLVTLERNDLRRRDREYAKLSGQLLKRKTERKELRVLRRWCRAMYHRRMDLVEFMTRRISGRNTRELQREVRERGLDPRIGQLATVADFFPWIFKAKKDLELRQKCYSGTPIIEDISCRVAARRAAMVGR